MKYNGYEINGICPICGGHHVSYEFENDELNTASVFCEECGAYSTGYYVNAFENWNSGNAEVFEEN